MNYKHILNRYSNNKNYFKEIKDDELLGLLKDCSGSDINVKVKNRNLLFLTLDEKLVESSKYLLNQGIESDINKYQSTYLSNGDLSNGLLELLIDNSKVKISKDILLHTSTNQGIKDSLRKKIIDKMVPNDIYTTLYNLSHSSQNNLKQENIIKLLSPEVLRKVFDIQFKKSIDVSRLNKFLNDKLDLSNLGLEDISVLYKMSLYQGNNKMLNKISSNPNFNINMDLVHAYSDDLRKTAHPIEYLHRCNLNNEILTNLVELGLDYQYVDKEYGYNILMNEYMWGREGGHSTFEFFYTLGVEKQECLTSNLNYDGEMKQYKNIIDKVDNFLINKDDIVADTELDLEKIEILIRAMNIDSIEATPKNFLELSEKFKTLQEITLKNGKDLETIENQENIISLKNETLEKTHKNIGE